MSGLTGLARACAALVLAGLALALAGCASRPPAPEWEMNAHGAMARYEQAYLAGADRAADAEFVRARSALGSTGRPELVARGELVRCALRVASLDEAPCQGFEALRAGAAEPEKAYAAYLTGAALSAAQVAQLPSAHRAVAGADAPQRLAGIQDPLSRLVAAGVIVRAGRGSPEVLRIAAETASQQGWRRPLLAWLGAQARLAEQAGQSQEAQRLRRRMDLVNGGKPQ